MTVGILIASLIQRTLDYSTPLIIAAIGALFSEKSGIIALGIEGMMTVGAFFGLLISYFTKMPPLLCFFAAGLCTMVFSMMYAVSVISFKADQSVSGIALNFIGPGLMMFLSRVAFGGTSSTPSLDIDRKIPKVFPGVFEQNSIPDLIFNRNFATYFAFGLVIAVYIFFNKTTLGFRIKSSGENPEVGEVLGINIRLLRYGSVLTSGFFAGLAGAVYSMSITSSFNPNLISGQGYISLASMIFGKWTPEGAMTGALIFGFTSGVEIFLKSPALHFKFPGAIISMIPYITTILILIFFLKKGRQPKSLGISF